MKIDRLIGIITYLLQVDKATTLELARRFEVCRRTILRDAEDLCKAGIPVVTTRGSDGGISIMEGYRLDKSLMTREELQSILAGLRGIKSVSKSADTQNLIDKLAPKSRGALSLNNTMMIDLSSFYGESLSEKIDLLKRAIKKNKTISFRYYYRKGEKDKIVEPYQIVYKWSDWYLFGFCTRRKDFRLFKLKRLWALSITNTAFLPREIPEEKKQFDGHLADDYSVTAIYAPSEKYRLVEEYGPDSFVVLEDGRLWADWGFADPDAAARWFLGFGDKAEVLEPPEMVEKIRGLSEQILEIYKRR